MKCLWTGLPIAAATSLLMACAPSLKGTVSGDAYTSPRALFRVTIPKARNFARVPFAIVHEGTREGREDYDEVAFFVKDFGETVIVGVVQIPDDVLRETAKDDKRTLHSKAAHRALERWRTFPEQPTVEDGTDLDTGYGEALLRVYLAKKGSQLTRTRPRDGVREPELFDTLIAVQIVKWDNTFVYAIAQNDHLTADGKNRTDLKRVTEEFFSGLRAKQ
jgi:hypothetical protein